MFSFAHGIEADAVRDRVVALTEDPSRRFDSPQPHRWPTGGKSPWAGEEPQLALSPLGHYPERRRPWGSGVFPNPHSKAAGIVQGKALLQYFIDRDGYPVLTTDGKPIHHLIDDEGNDVLNADGYPQYAVIDIPPGSSVQAYPPKDRRKK